MAKRKNKEEKEAIQAVKHQHANYKWLKYMFARMDELAAKVEKLDETVTFLSNEMETIKQQLGENNANKTTTRTEKKES